MILGCTKAVKAHAASTRLDCPGDRTVLETGAFDTTSPVASTTRAQHGHPGFSVPATAPIRRPKPGLTHSDQPGHAQTGLPALDTPSPTTPTLTRLRLIRG